MLIIPLQPGVPFYGSQVNLDGNDYILNFRWNERASFWSMDVSNAQEQTIVSGLRLLLGSEIGANAIFKDAFPRGLFYVVDTSSENLDPGLDDFGTRVQLYFFALAEFDLTGFTERVIPLPTGVSVDVPPKLVSAGLFYTPPGTTFTDPFGDVSIINPAGHAFFN